MSASSGTRGPIGTIFIVLLVPGATVVFNDASFPGVHRVLSERFFVLGSRLVLSLVRSTLFTTNRPATSLDNDGGRWCDKIARVPRVRSSANPLLDAMPAPIKSFGNVLTRRLAGRRS